MKQNDLMAIINSDGNYVMQDGTLTIKQSKHPVYKARIDLALGKNTWLYAPSSGHDLEKYKNEHESSAKIQEFQKELAFYLSKYSPDVTDLLINRGAVNIQLQIDENVLSG